MFQIKSQIVGRWTLLAVILAACVPATPSANSAAPASEIRSSNGSDALLITWKGAKDGNMLARVNPANGKQAEGFEPIGLGANYFSALSPDRNVLAAISYKSDMSPVSDSLHLIDLGEWQDHVIPLKLFNWTAQMDFSPDGKLLAIADYGELGHIVIVDISQRSIRAQADLKLRVRAMKFSSDGSALLLYGIPVKPGSEETTADPQALRLTLSDLSISWSRPLDGIRDGLYRKSGATTDLHSPGAAWEFTPGIVFAPVANSLFIVHADEDKLTTIDFDASTATIRKMSQRLVWWEQMLLLGGGAASAKGMDGTDKQAAISPDGKLLYVVGLRNSVTQSTNGEWQFSQTPLGMQIFDVASGEEVQTQATAAANLSISPDGKYLYLHSWVNDLHPQTEIYDTVHNKIIESLPSVELNPAWTIDGTQIVVSSYSSNGYYSWLATYDPVTWKKLGSWNSTTYASWVVAQ